MAEVDGSIVTEDRVSTVIALLPTSVQNRFSPFRHIRRSISLSNIVAPSFSVNDSLSSRPRLEGNPAPTITVEPLSTSGDVVARKGLRASSDDGIDSGSANGLMARERFARQGAQLVGVSLASSHPDSMRAGAFERDAYVDGLSYLLRGLPEDLTPHEQQRLRRSLPSDLASTHAGYKGIESKRTGPPSALYRITSSISLRCVIAFSIILPYLILILRWLIGLERRLKVSENVGQCVLTAMNSLGYYSGRILRASNGQEWRVGQLLASCILWTVEEVSKGLADGVDRGLSGVGTQRPR